MNKAERKPDQLEDDKEPTSHYRSLGEWAEGDERDEIAAFEDDDDLSRRRDPLRKH